MLGNSNSGQWAETQEMIDRMPISMDWTAALLQSYLVTLKVTIQITVAVAVPVTVRMWVAVTAAVRR